MSDTVKLPPEVKRNDIVWQMAKQVFGKKSDNAGKEFFAPVLGIPEVKEVEVDGKLQKVLTNIEGLLWTGLSDSIDFLNVTLRKVFADIYTDNFDEKTGQVNWDQWMLDAADFTAGVQKLSDIESELDDLQALQQNYALDEQFGQVDDNGALTERASELQKLIADTAKKIKPLRVQKATIEAKYAERAAKRKAKKEAAEAAAKKAVGTSEPVAA